MSGSFFALLPKEKQKNTLKNTSNTLSFYHPNDHTALNLQNQKIQQTTLKGEIIQEYSYFVLGFVPANVARLKKDAWFTKLSSEQISAVEKHLEESCYQ